MRKNTHCIMVIDDLANRCHDCDILLDQNLVANPESRYEKLVSKQCLKLLGVKYALLRDEFYAQRPLSKQRSSLHRIFVSFGGSDLHNLTSLSIEAILKLKTKIPNLVADIVVGTNNPQLDQIEKQCAEHDILQLHIQSQEVAVLINQADIALGAGGSTHWERCFLGLPALIAIVADNQKESSELLASLGCCTLLGEITDITAQKIIDNLVSIANKPSSLLEMSKKASALISPEEGTQKVVAAIEKFLRGVDNG
jgi:UDP-2,4-diacetamido-2,4,6-trideoxy-beta-L-altropyranose hydrolase